MTEIKNKWLIGLLVLSVIALIFVLYGGSQPVSTNNTGSITNTTPSKNTVGNVPKTVSQPSPSTTDTSGAYIVYYTDQGFSPKEVQVPKAHLVKFINNSGKALLIKVDEKVSPFPSELNQTNSIGRGGVYTFNFTKTGFWTFYNVNNRVDKGNLLIY